MGDDIVKFWVGPDHRLFNIHAGLLKHRSSMPSIFDCTSTTDNRLVKSEDGGFILTNENAEAFAILVNCLYSPVTIKILSAETVQFAIPLYLIAELMEMSSLMNCVIDEIRCYDLQGLLPRISAEEVVEVYDRSKDGSKIWEYLVLGIVCKTIKGRSTRNGETDSQKCSISIPRLASITSKHRSNMDMTSSVMQTTVDRWRAQHSHIARSMSMRRGRWISVVLFDGRGL